MNTSHIFPLCFSTETPLTIAARIRKPGRMIVSMVNGGALLDYRTKEGVTVMHRAVQANNFEAVKTLLGQYAVLLLVF